MADLGTRYLGLALSSPLVVSASPLARDLEVARQLEDGGAGAIVLPSLFEEDIHHAEATAARFLHEQDIGHAEADSFLPLPEDYRSELDEYLELIATLKQALDIPVIASLNGISDDGWVRYGRELAEAGADALELNTWFLPADIDESSAEVESRHVTLLHALREVVDVPIAVKLTSQLSAPAHLVHRLEGAGAAGVVLFNRFYLPDIDPVTRQVVPRLHLSAPYEALLRIHWLALLHGRVGLSLAASGGFHRVEDLVKGIMAGADAIQVCSVLLRKGPGVMQDLVRGLSDWLDEQAYASVAQMRGSVSQLHAIDPEAYERLNYVRLMQVAGRQPPRGD